MRVFFLSDFVLSIILLMYVYCFQGVPVFSAVDVIRDCDPDSYRTQNLPLSKSFYVVISLYISVDLGIKYVALKNSKC